MASEVSSPEAKAAPQCANCGTPVRGHFCGHCGQKLADPVHSLRHFRAEALEDLTHADSRLWRTLIALLFRPGFLTREFLDGRRVRYLPPLRLYLVLSFVFFLLAAASPAPVRVVGLQQSDGGQTRLFISPTLAEQAAARPGETLEQRQERACKQIRYDGPWKSRVENAFRTACRQSVADNGRSLQEAFLHAVPRAMFLFLPVLALVMTLMYWRPRRYYLEQLLLLVHNHAFIFLLVTLCWLLLRLVPVAALGTILTIAALLYVPAYVYRSMRTVYGQSRLLTATKLAAMSLTYLISAVFVLAFTSLYSVLSAVK